MLFQWWRKDFLNDFLSYWLKDSWFVLLEEGEWERENSYRLNLCECVLKWKNLSGKNDDDEMMNDNFINIFLTTTPKKNDQLFFAEGKSKSIKSECKSKKYENYMISTLDLWQWSQHFRSFFSFFDDLWQRIFFFFGCIWFTCWN